MPTKESDRVLFYPGHVLIHPGLKKFFAALANLTGLIKQIILGLNERLRLSECWDIQIGQNIAQVLLGHRGANGTH